MDVRLRTDAWIVVERAERQAEGRRVGVEFGQDRRAANAAEAAMSTRRRRKERQQLLAGKKTKSAARTFARLRNAAPWAFRHIEQWQLIASDRFPLIS